MMNDGLGSMMGSMTSWVMSIGLLGWVLVIALLITIVVLLVRLVSRGSNGDRRAGPGEPTRGPS